MTAGNRIDVVGNAKNIDFDKTLDPSLFTPFESGPLRAARFCRFLRAGAITVGV